MRVARAPTFTRHAPDPCGPLVRRLTPFFGCKKANFWKKIWAKVSIQSELRISRYKRYVARAEDQSTETERDRETDPISEGLSPLPCHGGQGPEGKPFSHLGRRSRTKIIFGRFMIFEKKNHRKTVPEGATRQGAFPGPSWVPRKAVDALLLPQES